VGTVEYDPNTAEGTGEGALETAENAQTSAVKAAAPAMYTMLAREGIHAAQLLNAALAKRTVGKSMPRRLEVAAPIGQSTSGGKKARQALTLVAISGEGPSVMCGWIDAAQKTGELREYRALAEQYEARFGVHFEATALEYSALLKELENMLLPLGFRVQHEEFEASIPPQARPTPWKTVAWVLGAAAFGALIALLLS
jgi:hypothetical protein